MTNTTRRDTDGSQFISSVNWDLRVRYYECDAQGVVFNATYQAWADQGSLEYWRGVLGSYRALVAEGFEFVVVASSAEYHRSATYDEELALVTGVTRVGRTSFDLRTEITRQNESVAVTTMSYVFVDAATGAKREPTEAIRAKLLGRSED